MNTNLRSGLMIASLFLGVAMANASDSVHVSSSTHLRVLVVDATKPGATRSLVHETFATGISASLQRQCGGPVGVRIVDQTSSDRAAADLSAGAYDAALIFEDTLPADLRTSDFSSTQAVSQVGVPARVFHLVVRNDDPALSTMLTAAFNETLKASSFQDALGRSTALHVVANNLR
jgi:hypothetical protein